MYTFFFLKVDPKKSFPRPKLADGQTKVCVFLCYVQCVQVSCRAHVFGLHSAHALIGLFCIVDAISFTPRLR